MPLDIDGKAAPPYRRKSEDLHKSLWWSGGLPKPRIAFGGKNGLLRRFFCLSFYKANAGEMGEKAFRLVTTAPVAGKSRARCRTILLCVGNFL